MKKTGLKKITLNKETLRVLGDIETLNAVGGVAPETSYCSGSCAVSVCLTCGGT